MMDGKLPDRSKALLDAWFGPPGDPERERHRDIWFKGTPEFDASLRNAFLADYEAAARGALRSWEALPESALALVLLLDQIPRNIFRGSPRTYATDAAARAVADRALESGFNQTVPLVWRRFFYMPYHHSEHLADQRRSVALFDALPGKRDRRASLRRYGRPYVEVIERLAGFRTAMRSSAGNRRPRRSPSSPSGTDRAESPPQRQRPADRLAGSLRTDIFPVFPGKRGKKSHRSLSPGRKHKFCKRLRLHDRRFRDALTGKFRRRFDAEPGRPRPGYPRGGYTAIVLPKWQEKQVLTPGGQSRADGRPGPRSSLARRATRSPR